MTPVNLFKGLSSLFGVDSGITGYIKLIGDAVLCSFLVEMNDVVLYESWRSFTNDVSFFLNFVELWEFGIFGIVETEVLKLSWVGDGFGKVDRTAFNLADYFCFKVFEIWNCLFLGFIFFMFGEFV